VPFVWVFLDQRFPNFFQVGTTFISQNVLRTTLLLSPLKANCLRFSTTVCDTQFTLILFFLFFFTNVQSKRTTRAEPEDHLWSADHSLGNAVLDSYSVGRSTCLFCVGTSGNFRGLLETSSTSSSEGPIRGLKPFEGKNQYSSFMEPVD
jgi:hypothetical protein